ncbi:hypothetical protein FB45DRAFT_235999 [Roridomyces roridus]|uniref:Uncharacterized protein n=1 Tax=Roridomyces roridus TaxID=1738132 RepID=A0AAD7BB38_9AGAR|nr:hypothetical protein FB45DRAFT_235999 [Roridomyces roridus]
MMTPHVTNCSLILATTCSQLPRRLHVAVLAIPLTRNYAARNYAAPYQLHLLVLSVVTSVPQAFDETSGPESLPRHGRSCDSTPSRWYFSDCQACSWLSCYPGPYLPGVHAATDVRVRDPGRDLDRRAIEVRPSSNSPVGETWLGIDFERDVGFKLPPLFPLRY